MHRIASLLSRPILFVTLLLLAACSGTFVVTGFFGMALSPNTIVLSGTLGQPLLIIIITGDNGFSSTVTITFQNLPAGVTTSPAAPFTIPAGSSQQVSFGGTPSVSGTFTFLVRAEGQTSLSGASQVIVQNEILVIVPPPGVPGPNFDSLKAGSATSALDAARHQVFSADTLHDAVDVFSTFTGAKLAEISVPQPLALDLSPSGRSLLIASRTGEIFLADPDTPTIRARGPLLPDESGTRSMSGLAAVADDVVFASLREESSAKSQLVRAALGVTMLNSEGKLVAVNSADVTPRGFSPAFLARSTGASRILLASGDSGEGIALLDASDGRVLARNLSVPAALGAVELAPGRFALIETGGAVERFSTAADSLRLLP